MAMAFLPSESLLKSVDLPTLGRPMMAMSGFIVPFGVQGIGYRVSGLGNVEELFILFAEPLTKQ